MDMTSCGCMQTYLLKMSRSGEEGEKTFLLLEAGVRLHTTEVCKWCCQVTMLACCGHLRESWW